MIHVMSNWGDNAVLKEASSDDPQAAAIRKFRKSNVRGYNYARDFEIELAETLDESQRLILKLGELSATCSTSLTLSTKLIADKAI
jgi:hypothetical protein